MFIDASAIVAILKSEPDAEYLIERLEKAETPFLVSPLVRFEATVALARAQADRKSKNAVATPETIAKARATVDRFMEDLPALEVPITSEIAEMALDAAMTYGKVVGHAARLNFGDCFAYACAKKHQLDLLYKGDDFVQTDLA